LHFEDGCPIDRRSMKQALITWNWLIGWACKKFVQHSMCTAEIVDSAVIWLDSLSLQLLKTL
jgi:hypothetical protein